MIPGSTVHFDVAGVKANPGTRLACGIKIGTQAPSSQLYALPDVKGAVDTVAKDTTAAQAALDAYNKANAAFQKARTALGIALGNWDGSFDVLVAVCEKRCVTTDDGTSVGMPTLLAGRSKYPLLMPAGLEVRIDFNRNQLVSLVQKAKGLRMAVT